MKANQALIDPAISSKKWCGIVRSLYGYNKCYSAIPAICEGDVFMSDPKIEVNVFNDYFVSQATVEKLHFSLGGRQTLCLLSQEMSRWFITS